MKKYRVVGLMSGTSLDGLDIAYVEFYYDQKWHYKIICCESNPYDSELKEKLKNATRLNSQDLKLLDLAYGRYIGDVVNDFIKSHGVSPDLIVSHGHTVFHQPDRSLTLQIGDGYQIMKNTKTTTICDLRSLDVALGGQGAPLVPLGDKYLFGEYELCLNLGGFSNISFDKFGERIAYDVCPVNTVLNDLSSRINLEFDKDGMIARSGTFNEELYNSLNLLQYYTQSPPKSLGLEWVQEHVLPILKDDKVENLLNTYCHHISKQIEDTVSYYFCEGAIGKLPKILLTGGGAKNKFLVDLLQQRLENKTKLILPDLQIIDFKEALIFALLGLFRHLGKTNTLSSVTGSQHDSSGGVIYDHLISK